MFLIHPLKLIYIVVPGTGSNSFRIGMRDKYGPKEFEQVNHKDKKIQDINPKMQMVLHWPAQLVRLTLDKYHPGIWEEYKKIGFIREPLDWAASIYRKDHPGVKRYFNLDNDCTPNEWVERLDVTPFWWFTDEHGEMVVDKIWRLEDYKDLVCPHYGINYMHKGKSPRPTRPFDLDEEHMELLRQKFHREYEYYDMW